MSDKKRLEEIFDAALSMESDAREAYLAEACGADTELLGDVRALLEADRLGAAEPPREQEVAHATTVQSDRAKDAQKKPAPSARVRESEPEEDSIPRVVGRFEVLSKLGEGGMGAVYEAYDSRLDRKVAVKVMRVGRQNKSSRTRLLREAQAMARVAHPNVVAVFEVGAMGDELYVAMERVDGRTLSGWLSEATRDWREILGKLVDAARGLGAAHEAGIVHRDFKPDNVLVDREGRVRVLDFGLARARGDLAESDAPSPPQGGVRALELELTMEGTVMGTPSYMSPEHFQGRAVDPKSDQFCFGVALYRALWKQPPFGGATIGELRDNVLAGRVQTPPKSEVPEPVVAAIFRAISPSPDARFPTMNELVAELERALGHDPEHDPSVSRELRRRLGAAFVAAGGIAIAILFWTRGMRLDAHTVQQQAVGGTSIVLLVTIVFRKRLFATRYNRRTWALFLAPIFAFHLHRFVVLPMGEAVGPMLVGDALYVALSMALGGIFLERWLFVNAGLALAYVALALVLGENAEIFFPVMLFGTMATAIYFWRDPGKGKAGKDEPSKRSVPSSSSSSSS